MSFVIMQLCCVLCPARCALFGPHCAECSDVKDYKHILICARC